MENVSGSPLYFRFISSSYQPVSDSLRKVMRFSDSFYVNAFIKKMVAFGKNGGAIQCLHSAFRQGYVGAFNLQMRLKIRIIILQKRGSSKWCPDLIENEPTQNLQLF